MFHMKTPE